MALGYPALSRFFVLPAGLWCIVGAVGAAWGLEAARSRPSRLAAAGALAVAAVAFVSVRAEGLVGEMRDAVERAELESELVTVVERTPPAERSCGRLLLPADLGWLKGEIAWRLDLPLRDVRAVRTSQPPPTSSCWRTPMASRDPGPRDAVAVRCGRGRAPRSCTRRLVPRTSA